MASRPQYGVRSVLTNTKNVWFGSISRVAEAVMQLKYSDFRADPTKVDAIWRKHKCPGLVRNINDASQKILSRTGERAFYLNGKKFKHFVLQNVFNMKLKTGTLKSKP